MQTETPTETPAQRERGIRLQSLGEDINHEARNADSLAKDCVASGVAAVKCALRAGALLIEAKKLARGGFEKWLMVNCPELKLRTAERWIQLTRASHVTDLSSVKSIRQAYLAVGIIKDKAKEGIGTADVDLVKNFFAMLTRFESSTGKVFEIAKKVDPIEIGHERRAEIIEKTKPMIEFVDRIKAAEAA